MHNNTIRMPAYTHVFYHEIIIITLVVLSIRFISIAIAIIITIGITTIHISNYVTIAIVSTCVSNDLPVFANVLLAL